MWRGPGGFLEEVRMALWSGGAGAVVLAGTCFLTDSPSVGTRGREEPSEASLCPDTTPQSLAWALLLLRQC